jgi:hypothetical protein
MCVYVRAFMNRVKDEVRPFDVQVTLDSIGRWCAELALQADESDTFFPVLVYENWEELLGPTLSTSEKTLSMTTGILFSVFLGCRCLFFLCAD